MKIQRKSLRFEAKGGITFAAAMEVAKQIAYGAYAEASELTDFASPFTILLSIEADDNYFELEYISHMAPFMDRVSSLIHALAEREEKAFSQRMSHASNIVLRIKGQIMKGEMVPYEISMKDGVFYIFPREYVINTPVSTSDLLLAISALVRGCVLNINHNSPPTCRDILLFEYLSQARNGEPIDLNIFHFKENLPERWYMRPAEG